MDYQEHLQKLYQQGRKAYFVVYDYTQEQIDRILENMALRVYEHAEELGVMAYEESQLGDPESKINGLKGVPMYIWGYLKDKKSVGLVTEDKERQIDTYKKGMGVIACLTPSTVNIVNGFEIALKAIKSGNAIILAPHPRAWNSSKRLAEILSDAITEVGGPEHLVQSMDEPTHEKSGYLMSICDVVVGTGGTDMVKAAYSCGKPAIGVGAGNVPAIISTSLSEQELEETAIKVVNARASDNGILCVCPQVVFIPRVIKDKVLGLLQEKGAYLVDDEADVDRIRNTIFNEGPTKRMDVNLVGLPASELAPKYRISDFPDDKKIVLLRLNDGVRGDQDCLTREILNPTLRYQIYDDYADAIEIIKANLFNEGAGHSAQIYSNDQSEIDLAARRLPVVRVLVKQTGMGVSNFTWQNGMSPSSTIGCGTWGGNSLSDNLDYTTLQNNTMVIRQISATPRTPSFEDVFGSKVTVGKN